MATRSVIGVERADGSFLGVYCHYDGYPSHVVPLMQAMSREQLLTEIEKAIAEDGMRQFMGVGSETFTMNHGSTPDGSAWDYKFWPCRAQEYNYRLRLDGEIDILPG
jgi:hypothetical protein